MYVKLWIFIFDTNQAQINSEEALRKPVLQSSRILLVRCTVYTARFVYLHIISVGGEICIERSAYSPALLREIRQSLQTGFAKCATLNSGGWCNQLIPEKNCKLINFRLFKYKIYSVYLRLPILLYLFIQLINHKQCHFRYICKLLRNYVAFSSLLYISNIFGLILGVPNEFIKNHNKPL